MYHRVKYGESPTAIARRYGTTLHALVAANPHKPTTHVNGQRTWQGVLAGEEVNLPHGVGGGFVGDAVSDAIGALIAAGGPCVQRNSGIVCAVQAALGVTIDGKYGPGTAAAAKARFGAAPPACSPTPSFWVKGQSACPGGPAAIPAAAIPSFPTAIPTSFPIPAGIPAGAIPPAVAALASGIDPCLSSNVAMVCAAQKALGVTVDGKYGNDTANALRRFIPSAPPGCSPRPAFWKPPGQTNCGSGAALPPPVDIFNVPPLVLDIPTPPPQAFPPPSAQPIPVAFPTSIPAAVASAPAAVAALANIDVCAPENVALICAAQAVMGVTVDGKYGNDTSTAARRLLPGAPPGCSPRPAHWRPPGVSNCTAAPTASPPPFVPPPVAPTPSSAQSAPAPSLPGPISPSGGEVVTAPGEKKGLSTGAMIAGGVGVLALVGIVAIAATSGKKGSRGSSGKRGPRGPKRRSAKKRK